MKKIKIISNICITTKGIKSLINSAETFINSYGGTIVGTYKSGSYLYIVIQYEVEDER
jgi:hypothetical protein